MKTIVSRKVGEIHSNGKWVWTEYQAGKFDWRAIKGANVKTEEVKEEPKNVTGFSIKKLTAVQQQVMNRFAKGQKLVSLQTNRMTGDALFWCKEDKESGLWRAEEKAMYPQLRRLFWAGLITEDMWVDATKIDREYNQYELHVSGAIGF